MTCTSSSTRTNGSRSPRSAARRGIATSSILGIRPDNSSRSSPQTGPVRSRAATTWASSTTGSLSPRAELHPPGWPSDPGQSTARQESTSRNPPAQKPVPPGCARRPSVRQRGEVARPPEAGRSELELRLPQQRPGPRNGQRYSSLGPPRPPRFPCQRDFGAGPRPASLRRRHEDAVPPRKRGLHAIWRSTVLTTNARCAHRPHSPQRRDRANISDKSVAPFANQSHYLTLKQSRSAASGDATSRCPIHGQPSTVPGPDRRGIREKPHRTRRESCDSRRRVLQAPRLGRDRGPVLPQPGHRQSPANAAASSCSSGPRSRWRRRRPCRSSPHEHPGRRRRSPDRLKRGAWHGDISQIGR